MASNEIGNPDWDAAAVIRQGLESYLWFRLAPHDGNDSGTDTAGTPGDVVLTCDSSGLIVDLTEARPREDDSRERKLVGRRLADVIGESYQKALEQLVCRRPDATLGFKFVRASGEVRHCRMMVRRTSATSGRPLGTVIALSDFAAAAIQARR